MAKKADWEDKKIKKSRLKFRDFDWMEKNGGSEARNSSLEILIEREERSYGWEGIKNLKTKIFYRLWLKGKRMGLRRQKKSKSGERRS
jgi:hypothetical protein